MSVSTRKVVPPGRITRFPRWRTYIGVAVLILAACAGGAAYYVRYGDKTSTDYETITTTAADLLKVDVPGQLWPRIRIERPDVMTMVVFATKDDDSCLAIARCLPQWAKQRYNRPQDAVESALEQYYPDFDTSRWMSVEERDVTIRGTSQKVKIGTARRGDDHKECRTVVLESMATDKGAVSFYYQEPESESTDADIEILLKSMR